jgi:hypothetical protein
MNFEVRLSLLRFEGIQVCEGHQPVGVFTDLDTGSTFHVEPGQTLGQALAQFALRWELAVSRSPRGQ